MSNNRFQCQARDLRVGDRVRVTRWHSFGRSHSFTEIAEIITSESRFAGKLEVVDTIGDIWTFAPGDVVEVSA